MPLGTRFGVGGGVACWGCALVDADDDEVEGDADGDDHLFFFVSISYFI